MTLFSSPFLQFMYHAKTSSGLGDFT